MATFSFHRLIMVKVEISGGFIWSGHYLGGGGGGGGLKYNAGHCQRGGDFKKT